MNLTSSELHDRIGKALDEISRQLASGELDQSGRYYTDEQLAGGAALRGDVAPNRWTVARDAKAAAEAESLAKPPPAEIR